MIVKMCLVSKGCETYRYKADVLVNSKAGGDTEAQAQEMVPCQQMM